MTIDPSSIPNFGGQPQPQAAGPAGPVVPDQDLVKQLLDQMELKYVVDDEGDLAAPWEEFRTYFMFRGEDDQQVFSVRTFYDRPHAVEDRPRLLDAIDDWNRRTLWPKVYTHLHDEEEDGPATIRLIGEAQMLIGTGVSLEHFVSSTVSWVRAAIEFDKWLAEQLGLETADEKPDEKPADDA
ncbi:YbjN domain-containing protein [Streptomyces sp. NBC_00210]|uniref:YbjN domain-containing protein n=1 Tax=unclassified Streptomyces TaxID=2593676 RepID=UPI003250E1B6